MKNEEKLLLKELHKQFRSAYYVSDFITVGKSLGLDEQTTKNIFHKYSEDGRFVHSEGITRRLPRENEEELKLLIELISLKNYVEPSENLVNMAYGIFIEWREHHRIPRRPVYTTLEGSVFLAARKLRIPISLDSRRKSRSYIEMFKTGDGYQPAQEPPHRYVPHICNELELSDRVKEKAVEIDGRIRDRLKNKTKGGINPRVYSAGMVYIAGILCGERRSQREVAEVSRVTEVSLYNWVEKIIEVDEETRKHLEEKQHLF